MRIQRVGFWLSDPNLNQGWAGSGSYEPDNKLNPVCPIRQDRISDFLFRCLENSLRTRSGISDQITGNRAAPHCLPSRPPLAPPFSHPSALFSGGSSFLHPLVPLASSSLAVRLPHPPLDLFFVRISPSTRT